ncbi:MAG: hypothetical protein ACE1ZZ_03735 [Dehalococcoidia bacterium]
MKAKILGIVVISGLTLSMIVTGVAAVTQAVNAETSTTQPEQLVLRQGQAAPADQDSALISSLKFVCPFH